MGVIGLILTGVALLLYGFSSYKCTKPGKHYDRKSYLLGHVLFASAFFVWGLGLLTHTNSLNNVIIFGDILIFGAIITLLLTLVEPKEKVPAIITGIISFSLLLWIRLISVTIEPTIKNGILVFNTPKMFGIILLIALFIVWIRTAIYYFETNFNKKLRASLRSVYIIANLIGFVSVACIVLLPTSSAITASLAMLILSFSILTYLNYYSLQAKNQ